MDLEWREYVMKVKPIEYTRLNRYEVKKIDPIKEYQVYLPENLPGNEIPMNPNKMELMKNYWILFAKCVDIKIGRITSYTDTKHLSFTDDDQNGKNYTHLVFIKKESQLDSHLGWFLNSIHIQNEDSEEIFDRWISKFETYVVGLNYLRVIFGKENQVGNVLIDAIREMGNWGLNITHGIPVTKFFPIVGTSIDGKYLEVDPNTSIYNEPYIITVFDKSVFSVRTMKDKKVVQYESFTNKSRMTNIEINGDKLGAIGKQTLFDSQIIGKIIELASKWNDHELYF